MDFLNLALFSLAALLLLGSPGPAIAALVAVGKEHGFGRGLRFYLGLQLGVATACAISAAGLFSLLQAIPGATQVMGFIAAAYLIYLAYKIAFMPVGNDSKGKLKGYDPTPWGGFLIGIINPKAYMTFISIMSTYLIVPQSGTLDMLVKWAACVVILVSVDALWLWLGDALGKANLSVKTEKALNMAMGLIILVMALLALMS